jgi:hypothetical protein
VNMRDTKPKECKFTKNDRPKLGLQSVAQPIAYFSLFFHEDRV